MDDDGARRFRIERMRPANDAMVVKFAGTGDRNQAEALKGTRLFVARAMLPEPDEEDLLARRGPQRGVRREVGQQALRRHAAYPVDAEESEGERGVLGHGRRGGGRGRYACKLGERGKRRGAEGWKRRRQAERSGCEGRYFLCPLSSVLCPLSSVLCPSGPPEYAIALGEAYGEVPKRNGAMLHLC